MRIHKWKVAAAACMMAAAIVVSGCGEQKQNVTTESSVSTEEEVKGKVQDTGVITALCPVGWKSLGYPDLKAADAETMLDNGFRFVKGGKNEKDLLTNGYIEILYYRSKDAIPKIDPADWYNDVVQIGEFKTGDNTWEGYSGTTMGKAFVYLESKGDGPLFTVYLYTQDGTENAASFNSAEVQAILKSLALSENK